MRPMPYSLRWLQIKVIYPNGPGRETLLWREYKMVLRRADSETPKPMVRQNLNSTKEAAISKSGPTDDNTRNLSCQAPLEQYVAWHERRMRLAQPR